MYKIHNKTITMINKTISFILVFAMLFSLLSMLAPTIAADAEGEEYSSKGVYLLCEENERRAEYEKHYITSDGKFIAVTYPEQVHYRDNNGVYLDIDCSLKRNEGFYNTENGDYYASFPEMLSSGSLLSAGCKEQPVIWSVSVQNTSGEVYGYAESEGEIVERSSTKPETLYIDDPESFDLPNLTSTIRYRNVFEDIENIDAVYTISYNKVKEDIVLNSLSDISSIIISVNTDHNPVVNENGSVDFFNEDELQFSIGAPYLYDAKDEISNNINVSADFVNGVCVITYLLDQNWLEDENREYPVVFDPSITTREYSSNIIDTYVIQDDPSDHSAEARLYVGIKSGKLTRTYIKINNLPAIDPNCPILSATLSLKLHPTTTTGKAVTLYKVNQSWSTSGITYANQPSSTSLSSCPFDASTLYYNLNVTSDFVNLYDEYISATNYGYMIRYTDESFTNPDWNPMLSMEYTSNTGYRPIFTVVYGYTLPSGLTSGGVYVFKNTGSNSIMNVHNGQDSNQTNVYQKDVLPANATSAQKFKLEYISSTGCYYLRAMCSSGGANRVLDIVKSNGYVENGCNVQIYAPTDPLAQHWLIIPLGGLEYKIIPRTNMSLALTAYGNNNGSSSGTSTTSSGNIFVSTYSGSDYQKWQIYDCSSGSYISSSYYQTLENDTYYFNNLFTGKYLHRQTVSSADTMSGLIDHLENSIRWKVTYQGNDLYTIQSSTNLSLYLNHTANNTVSIINCSGNGNIPDSCLWKIKSNGGTYIGYETNVNNVTTNYYLSNTGTSLTLVTSRGSSGSDSFKKTTWRTASIDYYSGKELNNYFSVSDMVIDIGESKTPTINKSPSNALWANPSDFIFSTSSSDKITVSFDKINAIKRGVVEVTATHKVTNRIKTFEVFVKNSLLSDFDILELYDEFDSLLGNGYATLGGYNIYTVSEVVEEIVDNDQTITNFCNDYRIPKEFVQSVLFREIWCYSVADAAADVLVQEYYAWMEGTGSHPLIEHTDSSTGLGQIFASTAIDALNNADDRGFITILSHYNKNNWQDVWYVWQNLHDDDSYNIQCCALVILDCQYEFSALVPYSDFFDYSEEQIKTILSRYNGYGNDAVTYGNICYSYYGLFEEINS